MVTASLPFSLVKNSWFCIHNQQLRPSACMPSRQRLKVLLDKEYHETRQGFFADPGTSTKVSLALDSWTSPGSRYSFLAIGAYNISTELKCRHILIGFERLTGTHSGENWAEVVIKVATEYNLLNRLYAVTANNASNNATLCRTVEHKLSSMGIGWRADVITVNCMAHILNLSARALLQGVRLVNSNEDDDEDNDDADDDHADDNDNDGDDDNEDDIYEDDIDDNDEDLDEAENDVAATVVKVCFLICITLDFLNAN